MYAGPFTVCASANSAYYPRQRRVKTYVGPRHALDDHSTPSTDQNGAMTAVPQLLGAITQEGHVAIHA